MRACLALLACSLPAVLAGTNAFGKKFLEGNKAREGVITLPSGLQYKVLRDGDGERHPLADTSCECHYEGRTAQEWSKAPKGKKFDSSYDRGSPTSFAPSGVVAGWTEAMQLMVEGDQWELYLPSEMGYGDSGQGSDIGPGDVLVFTIEIIKINGASKEAQRGPPPYAVATSVAELQPLFAAGTPLVLGLFRQPLQGKLQDGFKSAARRLKKVGWAVSTALSAESKYDPKAKKFAPSEVETHYQLSAPGVYVSSDGGKGWTTCKTSHSQNSVSVADVAEKVNQCAAAAVAGKPEL